MKYFIFQGNDHDCGFAALKMYLAILAKDRSYLYIPKPSKRGHYTISDLREIAKNYGVELVLDTATKDYYDQITGPVITLIDENHAVVVVKRKKRYITLYDPGRGKVKMRKEEFLRRWRTLLISTDHPEEVAKISKIRQYLLPPKMELVSNLISLISAGLLIGTFYLLNDTNNFLFSFIFLSLFMICQILDRFMLYKQIHKFDLEYIPKYFSLGGNCSREKYIEFGEYKKRFFTKKKQVVAEVLIAFCITFLLCFNDFRNVFVLLALILIKILEMFLLSRNENDRKNSIAEIESKAFNSQKEFKDYALLANLKADGSIFAHSIKEVFYIFACFVFAVAMMFISGNNGCNFVIFHFVMYFAGFNAYNIVLIALSSMKEEQKAEQRFFDSCNL